MGEFAFLLKKILTAMVLPPTSTMFVIFLGLLLLRKQKRLGVALIFLATLITTVLSMTGVAGYLLSTLQYGPPLSLTPRPKADAIVVLAGGIREQALEYGSDQLNFYTLERLRYGAWLAKRTGLPILVTGGTKFDGPTEAQVMAQALRDEYGLTARWVESNSRDTADNATMSASMLREAGISRVLLVTHAWHMRRALAEFRAARLHPIPAPTIFVRENARLELKYFIPNARSLFDSSIALHEWLGIFWARVRES